MSAPIGFPEANITLGPPGGYEEEVVPLPVLRKDFGMLVSCWQLTPEEKVEVARTGKIWLSVWGGNSQPPVYVAAFKGELVP